MTIIGAAEPPVRAERGPVEGVRGNREVPPTEDQAPEAEAEVEAEVPPPEPEPEDEPEPELPPAAEEQVATDEGKRRWWRRRSEEKAKDAVAPPSHVRVLSAHQGEGDPWEQGFDEPVSAEADEVGEDTDENVAVGEPGRRLFRRR
jgi:hypothetical protein